MIDWQRYDPSNPPPDGVQYLVSDGTNVEVAYLYKFWDDLDWCPPDRGRVHHDSIKYYALINTPEKMEDAELL